MSIQQDFEGAYAEEDTGGDDLGNRINSMVHSLESQLGRPLSQAEYEKIEFAEAQKTVAAERDADGFLNDLHEQIPRLEAKLDRKLLQHEIDGIVSHGAYAAHRNGGPLDAESAHDRYWTHRTAETGEGPPKDKTDDEYQVARMRDLNARAEAEAAEKAEAKANEYKIEFDDSGTITAEHENAQRMQALILERNGEPIPRWLEEFANPAYVAAQHEETDEAA